MDAAAAGGILDRDIGSWWCLPASAFISDADRLSVTTNDFLVIVVVSISHGCRGIQSKS